MSAPYPLLVIVICLVSSLIIAGSVIAFVSRYMSIQQSRQDARDDRLFLSIEKIAVDKGNVIRENTIVMIKVEVALKHMNETLKELSCVRFTKDAQPTTPIAQ